MFSSNPATPWVPLPTPEALARNPLIVDAGLATRPPPLPFLLALAYRLRDRSRLSADLRCINDRRTHAFAARLGVPAHVVQLTLLVEDKRFWRHPGIDLLAVHRAALLNLHRRGRLQGASTIPEQLIKLGGSRSKTLLARSRRAALAALLIATNDRRTVLEAYLRCVYFGRGAYGIRAAARTYFKLPIEHLDAAQAFFLAERIALPNAARPSRIANLIERPGIRLVMRDALTELPVMYGRHFGLQAEYALRRVLSA